MLEEVFKDCKYYEELYEVSNYGRVRNKKTKRFLTQHDNGNGYLFVQLWRNNKGKREYVHRLVALAFIPNPDNKKEVNHINSIRTDNFVENLEWVTRKENIDHASKEGHRSKYLVLCLQTGEVFKTTEEAAKKNGGDSGNIRRSARGYDMNKQYSVYGYTYCYLKNENYYKNLKDNNLEVI